MSLEWLMTTKLTLQPVDQWRREDVRGPWTTDSPGPLPILHNLIPLTSPPPDIQLYSDFAHVYLYYMISNMTHFNQYTSHGVGAILEIWVPLMARWEKWGPLMTQ